MFVIFAVLLSAVLDAAPAVPRSFIPPKGWTQGKDLPPGGPDAVWLSPGFGLNGNGENLALITHPVAPGTTVASEAEEAIREMSADRTIVDSHSQPTCHGRQAGWTFDARLPLPNGATISQVYHISIVSNRAYSFVFTHKAGDPIETAVANAIQSICPQ
jgi:hypothetical protein